MVVNKTTLPIFIDKQLFLPESNDYLNSSKEKVSLKTNGYHSSESIAINTIGLSGILALDLKNYKHVQKDILTTL